MLISPGTGGPINIDSPGRTAIYDQRLLEDTPAAQFAVYGAAGWTSVDAYTGPSIASLTSWHHLYDPNTDAMVGRCGFGSADRVQLERPQIVVAPSPNSDGARYFSFVKVVPIGAAFTANPYLYSKIGFLQAPAFTGPWQVMGCIAPSWDGGANGAGITIASGGAACEHIAAGGLYAGDLAADIDPADGNGYLVWSAGYYPNQGNWSGANGLQINWLHVVNLNDNYNGLATGGMESLVSGREAPVLFRAAGRYYVASSATAGWSGSNTVFGVGNSYAAALANHDAQFPSGSYANNSVGVSTWGGQISGAYDLHQSGRPFITIDQWTGAPSYASAPQWAAITVNGDGSIANVYQNSFYIDTTTDSGQWGAHGTAAGWGPGY